MPRYNIWIRDEDVASWLAIKDRPQWLHEHLNQGKEGKPVYPLSDYNDNRPMGTLYQDMKDLRPEVVEYLQSGTHSDS